jgi:starvation-inducible DNA-binding protein
MSAPKKPIYSYETRIDIPSNTKQVSMALLNARLADTIDLALLTKQAHWNLKGRQFIALHEMLDGFRDQVDDWSDTMAERIAQLGGTALGTIQAVNSATTLPAYPTDIHSTEGHLKALAERYGQVANSVRKAVSESEDAGDDDSADIFTEVSRGLDKQLWFLEAHLEE